MKLLIVESPGKVQKIQTMLGDDWNVAASIGHVRDLPGKDMGVAAPDFTPHYEPTERGADVLRKLSGLVAQADAEEIYLATDPDREGEAIAWHVADALKITNPKRVTYAEITEKAVRAALDAPRTIDMNMVAAQEARRVLDRFCGYMVSGPLSRAVGDKLSAGRVQSPAVRLVVDREREIRTHRTLMHYGAQLRFAALDNISQGWTAGWKPWLEKDEKYYLDKATAQRVAALRALEVVSCAESESRTAPPAPFTTSSLQQAASNALKINPKKTMELAQKLYEAGHITYMRTDSPNLSEEAVTDIRAWCADHDFVCTATPRVWKSKEGAQEAHEAIRPTHVELEDAGDGPDQQALYRLIRLRAIASQLEDAVYAVRTAYLKAELDDRPAEFEAKGRTLVAAGWKGLTTCDQADDDEEPEAANPVPELQAGLKVTAVDGKLQEKKTRPPARFTEASLVRELEKRGIGRPSTYAAIISVIMDRHYVVTEKRYLVPTATGEAVVDHLSGNFGFVDYEFTRKMEDALDAIADGKSQYKTLMATAYEQLQTEVANFRQKTATPCPACASLDLRHLVKAPDAKDSRAWNFWACDECKATFSDENGKPGAKQEPKQESEHKCPECGKSMYRRQGEGKNGRAYDFWGCSGFRDGCKVTFNSKSDGTPDFEDAKKKETTKCPKCGKPMYRRQGEGKNGRAYDFWGCSGFRDGCKVTFNSKSDGTPDFESKK